MDAQAGKEETLTCPFNQRAYVGGLSRLGSVELNGSGRLALLRRSIPGTEFEDGIGPFPYLWIGTVSEEGSLFEDFPHLVTITAITQPGYVPASAGATIFKQHYVYDPALPTPPLSPRAQKRVEQCARVATFSVVEDQDERMEMVPLYAEMIQRKGLAGGFFDMGPRHFASIAHLDCGVFFRVARDGRTGAMACGVIFAGMLQILHTAMSLDGLSWNASYLLMHGLQGHAREHGLRMLTGGLPGGGTEGLRTFKARWANRFEPVYMLKIVNDPALYARLCSERGEAPGFFPAYRAP